MRMRGDRMDLYNLRHTFATRSILSGTDVTILQKILGHSEIGMTMRYVKIAEHYRVEAVERLENYRAVQMQEVEKRLGTAILQLVPRIFPIVQERAFGRCPQVTENIGRGAEI